MSIEHRGFLVDVDVVPDDTGFQWLCRATIEGVGEKAGKETLPGIELTIPKTKIDILMALSMVEHRAVESIDEWYERGGVPT
ncbi:hypothetical protein CY652_03690 [Burkholderia sp. WAC0059]|uniref:hypothetical protein n=1 Tax=Burkholderia sp. WAC0059 TaxID=2066022 RepID=UPI000C7EC23E|nr:hypothetical protein [Burkholderia sp. WAC0059]PLZ03506.1 hypothetical protein CY652_03690 [Burkholderia sp. WAC0059]